MHLPLDLVLIQVVHQDKLCHMIVVHVIGSKKFYSSPIGYVGQMQYGPILPRFLSAVSSFDILSGIR